MADDQSGCAAARRVLRVRVSCSVDRLPVGAGRSHQRRGAISCGIAMKVRSVVQQDRPLAVIWMSLKRAAVVFTTGAEVVVRRV